MTVKVNEVDDRACAIGLTRMMVNRFVAESSHHSPSDVARQNAHPCVDSPIERTAYPSPPFSSPIRSLEHNPCWSPAFRLRSAGVQASAALNLDDHVPNCNEGSVQQG
jgi:hypothetical protein